MKIPKIFDFLVFYHILLKKNIENPKHITGIFAKKNQL